MKSICPTFQISFYSKVLSKLLLMPQKAYGLNIQRLSISPNILKAGGIQIAIEILKSINLQNVLKIGDNLEIQSRKQNECSLT